MNSDLDRLRQGILNHGLHFGEAGSYIWDLREFLLKEDYSVLAANLLWKKIKKYQPEVLYGDGYGCAPLMFTIKTLASMDGYNIDVLWLRDKRKDHNRKRLIEGPRPKPHARAVYIDDLFSYGTTWSEVPAKLKEEKINIETVALVCVLDLWRNGGLGGTRRVYARGLPIESLFTRHDLGITRIDAVKFAIKKPLWRLLTKNLGNPRGIQTRLKCPPKIYKDKILHCTDQGDLYCLDLQTGYILWKYQPVVPYHKEKEVINEFQIVEDRLYYASYDGSCRCIDINTGEIIWQRLTATFQHSTPEFDLSNRRLYLNSELTKIKVDKNGKETRLNESSDVSCYNMDTGDLIWRSKPVNGTGPGSVTLINDYQLVVSSNTKSLRSYDARTGEFLWDVPFLDHIKGKSIVINEKIYAVDESGHFKIIDFNGKVLKSIRVGMKSRHQFLTWVPDLDYIIVTASNIIHAYNEHGDRVWVSRTRDTVETRGSLFGNYYLTVAKEQGYIQVNDVRDGSKVQCFHNSIGTILAPPSWDGKHLAIHSQNRGLYVYETNILDNESPEESTVEEINDYEIHY